MVILKKNKQTGKHFKEKVAFDPNTRKFASIDCKPEIEALREFSENSRMVILKKNKQTGKHFKEKVAFDPNTRKFASIEVGGAAITESVEMDKIIEVVSI